MRVHRLRLVNFRQHEETDLSFGLGLTGVIGPNGAGKTTLLEALAWAIYGAKAARGTVDSIRRRNAPARARVEVDLDFAIGAHRYRVVRTLHGAELYQDGGAAPVADSPSAVTERLTRVLGMTREEFFNTYFTGQKELAIMGAMTAQERERFLSRVLGYERLAVAQKRLSGERSGLRGRLQAIEAMLVSPAELAAEESASAARLEGAVAALGRVRETFAAAAAAVEALRPEAAAMEELQQRVRVLESDLRVAEQRVAGGREAFQRLDRDLAEALTAQASLARLTTELAPLAALQAERTRLDALAARLARRQELVGQVGEVKRQLGAIDGQLAALPSADAIDAGRRELEQARNRLAGAEETLQRVHTEWVRDLQDAQTKRQQLLEQHQDVKSQHERLREAGPEGVCPTCGRPLGTEVADVIAELSRQLDEITFTGNFYRGRMEQLKEEPDAVAEARKSRDQLKTGVTRLTARLGRLESQGQAREALDRERVAQVERLTALEAAVAEIAEDYDAARHAEVREALERLEPRRLEAQRLGGIAERAPGLTVQAAETEAELTRREARAAELREQLRSAGWSAEAYRALRDRVGAAERSRQECEVSVVRAESEVAAAEGAVRAAAARRAERDRRAAEAAQVERELMLNQELDRALTDLRGELNDTLRPDLSDLGSRFLRDLTMGRYTEFELNEDYVPTIVEDGEPQAVLSGGEEDVVSLALRLAISQMIAERAGQPLSLLILDEIFGSLDDERRSAVVDLLRRLADRFPQVILITHVETVRDGFDRVLRLSYDLEHGVARVHDEDEQGRDAAA